MGANHDDAIDISEMVFDIIGIARPGYSTLAGQELQAVEVLVSIKESPPDAESVQGDTLALVTSGSFDPW